MRSAGLAACALLCGVVALVLAGVPARAQTCAHDLCEEGDPLSSACDPCVTDICRADPFCCEFAWDSYCVEQVLTVCGDTMCVAACEHSPCEVGGPLVADCESCVSWICGQDPLCCNSQWDAVCVAQVETVCNGQCLQGADNCRDAVPLPSNIPGRALFGSLVGMNSDGCASSGDSCQSPDIWYTFTGTGEDVPIYTCSTQRAFGIDTVVSVHTDCPGRPNNELIVDDDWKFGPDPNACVLFHDPNLLDSGFILTPDIVPAGQRVYLRISHYAESTEGPVVLVPEPSTAVLGLVGLASLLLLHHHRRRS